MRLRKPGSRASKPSPPSARERAAKRAESQGSAPRPAGRRETAKDSAGSVGTVARRAAVEIVGIAREMIRIPAAIYLRVAEWLGAYVLAAWLRVWPLFVRLWHLGRRALAWAEQVVTPARVTVGVALLTAAALAASQWADLSQIAVGADNYVGLEDVATAPSVTTKTVGSAHLWLGVPLAIVAALLIVGSARGRPKLARMLIPVGIAVVAISLLIDRPEGLDKGNDEVAYESVTAELLPGFWAQLVSGGVLILLAVVLARVLQPERTASRPVREGGARSGSGMLRRLRLRGTRRTAEAGR